MHTMKKQAILIALLILAMLSAAMVSVSAADEVAINEGNFPDKRFREYVAANFDTDSSGSLSDCTGLQPKHLSALNTSQHNGLTNSK